MKPYGVKKDDQGCCPGHDKYDKDGYKISKRKGRKNRLRPAKKSERQKARKEAHGNKE